MTGNRIIVKEQECDRRFPTTFNEEILQSLCGTLWTLQGEDMYIFAQVGNRAWTMVSLVNGRKETTGIVQFPYNTDNEAPAWLGYFERCYGDVTIISTPYGRPLDKN